MTKTAQISNDQMIYSVQELRDKGFSYYKINQMVDQGILIKLNKKYYENTNFDGEELDFYYAYAFVPNGVVCLLSAAVYYNLSTYRPYAIDIAIPRKAKISTLPDWPELNVCYFTDDRFDVGIETIEYGKNKFRIYDIEKTVVDIVFYREKIGIEETKEVLTAYLHRSNRNLNRLIRYAEMLKCGDVMKLYLEVLV
jgi:predicted transcriptional regulator of viral defense system